MTYNPGIFLQIIHYALIDYSPSVYGHLVQKDYDLYATSDLRFTQGVFKVMVSILNLLSISSGIDSRVWNKAKFECESVLKRKFS